MAITAFLGFSFYFKGEKRGDLMDASVFDYQTEQFVDVGLKKLVVGYDVSSASDRALKDAIAIGKRFQSEIVLVQVNTRDDYFTSSFDAVRGETVQRFQDLRFITRQLAKEGLRSRGIVRNGTVAQTLSNVCCEEQADLLLLGAYGYRQRDRKTLGSTAESLLRAVPCPTLTYGPNVCSAADSFLGRGPVLLPVALPCKPGYLENATRIARLFGVGVEIIHVAGHVSPEALRHLENECQSLSYRLRCGGIHARWSLSCGACEKVILARAREIDSPFILLPLRSGNRLSSMTSDNVAAHVIRSSTIPVMTYRTN